MKRDTYKALLRQGMTYQQVADQFGVSRQAVYISVNRRSKRKFKMTDKECIYPALLEYLRVRNATMRDVCRMVGCSTSGASYDLIRRRLNGETEWKKSEIDAMLAATGMSYEKLFGGGQA